MPKPIISYGTRKALEVQLGEDAGREIVSILQQLTEAVATLEKKKVDVTPVVPSGSGIPFTSSYVGGALEPHSK